MPGVQQDLVLRHPRGHGFIIVNASVMRQIGRHRQTARYQPEAGGILMGLRRGRHIEVTMATTPKRADRRTRTAFDRASPFHQEFAVRAWRRFGCKLDYVGEWHTHPEHQPRPSMIDEAEWAKLIRRGKRDLLFIIVGISGMWIGMFEPGQPNVKPLFL